MGFPKFGLGKHSSSSTSLQTLDYTNHEDHPIELNINIESPPCVLYGSATESSGALLGGLLTVVIKNDNEIATVKSTPLTPVSSHQRKQLTTTLTSSLSHLSLSSHHQKSGDNLKSMHSMSNLITPPRLLTSVELNSVELSLIQKVRYERPFRPSAAPFNTCTSCKTKVTEFHRWTIINKPTELALGKHSFPFSHLIPGNLPATTHLGSNSHTTIKYELIAVVTYKHPFKGKGESSKRVLQLNLPISITRSILRGSDKNSLRVFSPTELTANAVLPNVVYPKSTFSMELKLDGICSDDRRWRMRKLNWRIEEKSKIRAYTCKSHKSKLKELEGKVKSDEERDRQLRKNTKPIKRSLDMGPQVKMTVNSFQDFQTSTSRSELSNDLTTNQSRQSDSSNNDGQDDDHDTIPDTNTDFIHPNDDAMRQEIMQQQQRLRQQQIEQELKQESALYTEEIRTIANGEVKSGWKSDFSDKGNIELVTDIDCMRLNSGVTNPINHASTRNPCVSPSQDGINVSCDIEDPTLGVYVSHLLFIEIIVAEEQLQNTNGSNSRRGSVSSSSSKSSKPRNNADQRLAELSPIFADRENKPVPVAEIHAGESGSKVVGIPTGAARVLRMQFRLVITERSGLGISWDDEVPPAYQDIKMLTPPNYNLVTSGPNSPFINPIADHTSVGSELVLDGQYSSHAGRFELIRPPPALHHSVNTSMNSISAYQYTDLDHIMSIQGAEPGYNSALTPQNTRMINVPNISELLDTDRITQ